MSVVRDHLIKARGLVQQAELEMCRAHTAAFDEGKEKVCRVAPEIKSDLRTVEVRIGQLEFDT